MAHLLPVALIVEDHIDVAEMYAACLEQVGFSVSIAENAAEGFILAVTQQPDVIVADVRLPGGPDGLTLAMKLRLDRRTTDIPIVVLTGHAEHRARADAAGCNVFLTKPCLPTVLVDHVRALTARVSRTSPRAPLPRSG